jgi:hypothetical protein
MQHLKKVTLIVLFPFVFGVIMDKVRVSGSADELSGYHLNFNPDHLDGPFTGGFGESTCHSCHFDYDLNMDGGSLSITGFPDRYEQGQDYPISIRIESERLEVGGFQVTTRFKESGSQAGSFSWEGNRLRFTPESSVGDSLKYLQHSGEGTVPTGERFVEWSFTWTAPSDADGEVLLHAASNAGNYDDSSFGDWIYVRELNSEPVE